jgi:hypothetical protein
MREMGDYTNYRSSCWNNQECTKFSSISIRTNYFSHSNIRDIFFSVELVVEQIMVRTSLWTITTFSFIRSLFPLTSCYSVGVFKRRSAKPDSNRLDPGADLEIYRRECSSHLQHLELLLPLFYVLQKIRIGSRDGLYYNGGDEEGFWAMSVLPLDPPVAGLVLHMIQALKLSISPSIRP